MNRSTREELQREIDRDRRAERMMVPYALLAVAVIAVIMVVREVFFV
ncbi:MULTISPECIES: hypothetical protein [Sanguibacter]|jgi:hypothetical protein|uniref:Uncharacterized protein n=2 Tax=Sanguibacter TaxID=60919 RepID=A0A853ESL3_9MICO|nr:MULTISPECIES: hypothetical protein [Sanguibacter]MBF0722481.1 hypothetical protein [Sanguibacter inulinus]NYS93626.1 hypothetical protein [Sanguibacter inulinus]WPF80963.1 hypothetical protein SANBI_002215 [Sanguibacter sp. 4.1]